MKSIADVCIAKAQNDIIELAEQYNVSASCIVWIGDNRYIIVKDGEEILIGSKSN